MVEAKTKTETWPYNERSGINAELYLEAIYSPPEIELSEAELEEVYEFGGQIFEGHYSEAISCQATTDLEKIYQTSPLASELDFYLDYFKTAAGQRELSRAGLVPKKPEGLSDILSNLEFMNAKISMETRKDLAAKSLNWYKTMLAARLSEDPRHDADYSDKLPLSVNYKPEKLVKKIEALQAYRGFFRQVAADLRQAEPTNAVAAKRILLSVYRGRINSMIADLYGGAFNLADQLRTSQDQTDSSELLSRLEQALPMVKSTFLQNREDNVFDLEAWQGDFSRRLDFIRNGAAWTDSADMTPISPELADLAESLSAEAEESSALQSDIPTEILEKLDSTIWEAEQPKELAATILSEWGLLSKHSDSWTEVEERDGFAADGLWQVVISPKVQSMSVNGSKRVLLIPESFKRSLTQKLPAGVLPGLDHELTHLLQNDYDYKTAQQVPLAKIHGRHASAVRETGALLQEEKFQQRFGRTRPVQTHYLQALRTKLEGGNKLQVTRAFYNSYKKGKTLSPDKDEAARKLAADRANRLYRHSGYNSAPLDYLEQELIKRRLTIPEAESEALLIAGASFDLRDLALLRRAGLIEVPRSIAFSPADEVWRVFQEKYLSGIQSSLQK